MSPTTSATVLRLGTRGSKLATTQAGLLARQLNAATGVGVELVTISTEGDRSTAPLASFGGVGVFVSAVRDALAAGEVDFVVHSLKDLPTASDPRLALAAVPMREDPRDCLVARDNLDLGQLPPRSRVGTGSPRRAAQLEALGLGLEIVPLRGNVDTRIAKVTNGELDGVVLAMAGLSRLGRADEATEILDPLQMLPAPGQGALACECRVDDVATLQLLDVIDHPDTRAAVTAERALLATLEAGCSAPVGALAEIAESEDGDELWIRAWLATTDGTRSHRLSSSGLPDDAEHVGRQLAEELLGALDLRKGIQ
jgi:hydroxymethylbilane synthase